VLGRHRLRFVQYRRQSCWKPLFVASTTARMSDDCRCTAKLVASRLRLGHTGTAWKETSGGISRTAEVEAIILNVCSVTYSCRLTKTDMTLASASQTVIVMTNSRSAAVCCACALILLLSLLHCLVTAVHKWNCSRPLTNRSPDKRRPMKVTRDVCV
jgi:hypothetical protein